MTAIKKLSCSTNLYASHSLETALKHISRLGFSYVDLWASPPIVEHVKLKSDDVKTIRKTVEGYGLKVSSFTLYYTTHEEKLKGIEWAAELGASLVIFEPAPSADFIEKMSNLKVEGRTIGNPGDSFERFVENLAPYLRRAEEMGIKVALEVPHVYTLTERLDEVLRLMKEVNSPTLGFTLAPPHIVARGGDILEAIWALKDHLLVFYLWDVRKGYKYPEDDRRFGNGYEQMVGNGCLNYPKIFATLNEIDFDGFYEIKCHGTEGWTDVDEVTKVVAQGLRNIEPIM